MYTFIVADDHPLFRDAIVSVLENQFPGCHVEQTDDMPSTLALVGQTTECDLLLLDLNMPGMAGLSGLLELRNVAPTTPVAVISAESDKQTVLQTLAYGAVGYVAKSCARQQMGEAFAQILRGDVYLPADILRENVKTSPNHSLRNQAGFSAETLQTLTRKQLQVLQSMSKGSANKQIAYDLNISETTVKSHVSAILKKLGVHNRIQAVLGATNIDFAHYLRR
ncbi:response regulator transcription factor [Vibrio mimicus]